MQTYEELVDQRAFQLMQMQKARFGAPCAGSTSDIWSLASCRESFGCLRVSFVLDGDLIEQLTGNGEYSGKLVDTLEHYELRNELRYEKGIRNALRAS
jgi:hypothetical protein